MKHWVWGMKLRRRIFANNDAIMRFYLHSVTLEYYMDLKYYYLISSLNVLQPF